MHSTISTWFVTLQLSTLLLCTSCSDNSAENKSSVNTPTSVETTRTFSTASENEPVQDPVTASVETSIQTAVTKNGSRRKGTFSLKKWQSSFREEVQTFRVQADEEIHIVGKRRTEVFFPALSFADASGKVVHGEVELRLKECYDFLAFFADGLSTATTDGKPIETGGTIRLQAFQKGKELTIVPGAEGKVLFPKNGSELAGMQTFYGETRKDDIIAWEPQAEPISTSSPFQTSSTPSFDTESSSRKMRVDRLEHTEITTVKDDNIQSKEVTWKLRDTSGTLLSWLENQTIYDAELEDFFFRRNGSMFMNLRFDGEGKISQITYGKKTPLPLIKAMDKFLKKAPAVNIAEMGNYKKSSVYLLGLDGVTKTIPMEDAADLGELIKAGKITKADSIYWSTKQQLYYALSINKMGWINCDRFYNSGSQMIDFAIQSPKETDFLIMQFKNFRGQMMGWKLMDEWHFNYLPKGEPFKVIAVTVVQDQRYITVQNGFIEDKKMTIDKGEPMTDEEFAAVIR